MARYGRPAAVLAVDLRRAEDGLVDRFAARVGARSATRRARPTASPGSVRTASRSCCPRPRGRGDRPRRARPRGVRGAGARSAPACPLTSRRGRHATSGAGRLLEALRDVQVRLTDSASGPASRTGARARRPGSSVRPVWTAEGWMIVLAGATSQWNRSAMPERGDRPARRVARGRWARSPRGGDGPSPDPGRARAPRGGLVEVRPGADERLRPAQQDDPDVEALPALDPRDDADDGVLVRATRLVGHARPPPRTGAARPAAAPGSGRRRARWPSASPASRSSGSHTSGMAATRPSTGRRVERAARAARRPRRSSRRTAAGRGRAIRSNGRRACSSGSRQVWWTYSAAPWSISHGRPCQTSRFGLATVRSGFVASPSSQTIVGRDAGSTSGGRPG